MQCLQSKQAGLNRLRTKGITSSSQAKFFSSSVAATAFFDADYNSNARQPTVCGQIAYAGLSERRSLSPDVTNIPAYGHGYGSSQVTRRTLANYDSTDTGYRYRDCKIRVTSLLTIRVLVIVFMLNLLFRGF